MVHQADQGGFLKVIRFPVSNGEAGQSVVGYTAIFKTSVSLYVLMITFGISLLLLAGFRHSYDTSNQSNPSTQQPAEYFRKPDQSNDRRRSSLTSELPGMHMMV